MSRARKLNSKQKALLFFENRGKEKLRVPIYVRIEGVSKDFQVQDLNEERMGFKLEIDDSLVSQEVTTMNFTIFGKDKEAICEFEWIVKF